MKGTTKTFESDFPIIEDGTYTARLASITAWTSGVYQRPDETEPVLSFNYELVNAEREQLVDDNDRDMVVRENFLKVPLGADGLPAFAQMRDKAGKLFQRMDALTGGTLDPASPDFQWELMLPTQYDDAEGLMSLPAFFEKKGEGFKPVHAEINVGAERTDIIGRLCQLKIVNKTKVKSDGTKATYTNVEASLPMPRANTRARKAAPVVEAAANLDEAAPWEGDEQAELATSPAPSEARRQTAARSNARF